MKTCTKCGAGKEASEFAIQQNRKDGLTSSCKVCFNVYAKARYQRKRAELCEKQKLYALENKERLDVYRVEYRAKNKEIISEKKKLDYLKDPQKIIERSAQWTKANPSATKAHAQNFRAKQKGLDGRLSRDVVTRLLVSQNNCCAACKLPLSKPFHIDHIKPISKGGPTSTATSNYYTHFATPTKASHLTKNFYNGLTSMTQNSNFTRVAAMNTAFGNPVGTPAVINLDRVRSQTRNIMDEFCELQLALGASQWSIDVLRTAAKGIKYAEPVRLDDARDGLCDIHVFAYGAHHLMGIDADADMNAVLDGVMTRFIKDEDDKQATIKKHAAKGIEHVYFEGEFPVMVMKSALDQPDAPKGKFLKSASYSEPVFQKVG